MAITLFDSNFKFVTLFLSIYCIIYYLFMLLFIIRSKSYFEFDRNDMELKIIQTIFSYKYYSERYDLNKIEFFKCINNNKNSKIQIKYIEKNTENEKVIDLFTLHGNYPAIYESLENFLNEKLQKITKRNIHSNFLMYEV